MKCKDLIKYELTEEEQEGIISALMLQQKQQPKQEKDNQNKGLILGVIFSIFNTLVALLILANYI